MNRMSRTKAITWKPLCLQTNDNNYDDDKIPTTRPALLRYTNFLSSPIQICDTNLCLTYIVTIPVK